ncbi:MAG TPA: lytic transglycosylase domain-containing protein [Acidocella sp.]|nr:lytic transglycosylase domain-containing protein [Acidocella sp.]
MLSRLNVTALALATASVFVLGLVDSTSAQAKSPDMGRGPGPTPPPSTTRSAARGDQFAYAVPRNAPSPDVEVVLPEPLPPSAITTYKRILTLQNAGSYAEADRLISRLSDPLLLGPVLAARYLSNNYISSAEELKRWYARYSNQPDAPAIYALMHHKMPWRDLPPAPHVAFLPDQVTTTGAATPPPLGSDDAAWRRRFDYGLADWKAGALGEAATVFTQTATMSDISGDDRAASAFWAARAALRRDRPEAYLNWLQQAASTGATFYGLLAGRLLGQGFGPTGIAATLTEADVIAVDATPQGHLAFALLQVGQRHQAALALRALWPQIKDDPAFGRSVMAVAARAGLVGVTVALASELPNPDNEIAGASLPMPALDPAGGFTIDPALVYALTRTESGFNPQATSPVGARGLMQLMPATARYIRQQEGLRGSVTNPADNLALGQAYVRYLGEQPGIDDNLLAVLASYNAGPGAASAWYERIRVNSDPLMFIESIPTDQTRRFVKQVLADSWLYAKEIGLTPTSLDALAQGNFPRLNLNTDVASAN